MMNLNELKQNPERILNQVETAASIDKSRAWLERARWAKTGPIYFKVGRSVYYRAGDLADFIEAGRVTPANLQGCA
jgi:hypothetical protein